MLFLSISSFVLGLDNSVIIRQRQTNERHKYTQTIFHEGCEIKEIDNYYCRGKCVSGFVLLLNGNGDSKENAAKQGK